MIISNFITIFIIYDTLCKAYILQNTLDGDDLINLIKIGDDLIKQPETLQSLAVGIQFHVEVSEVRHRGKQNGYFIISFTIEILWI